jgi:hypothetical protein
MKRALQLARFRLYVRMGRELMFESVADYLEKHPNSTLESIDAACNVGCTYQVLEAMPSRGYGISSEWCWRDVACACGQRTRKVQTYALTHRPCLNTGLHCGCGHANESRSTVGA